MSPGKILRISAPSSRAFTASVGVKTPGIHAMRYRAQRRRMLSSRCGETMYCAPERTAMRAVSLSSTVPAPIMMSPFRAYLSAICSMSLCAFGTVKVSSIAATPPSMHASVMRSASASSFALTTATRPQLLILERVSSLSMFYLSSFLFLFSSISARPPLAVSLYR